MIIAVDFDGTIVEHRYPAIGPEAVEYCRRRGLEFFAVNSNTPQNELLPGMKPAGGKVSADVYIDDRNLGGLPEWDQIYEMITKQRAQKRRSRKKGFFDRLFGK